MTGHSETIGFRPGTRKVAFWEASFLRWRLSIRPRLTAQALLILSGLPKSNSFAVPKLTFVGQPEMGAGRRDRNTPPLGDEADPA
jgi:hypothetical protein